MDNVRAAAHTTYTSAINGQLDIANGFGVRVGPQGVLAIFHHDNLVTGMAGYGIRKRTNNARAFP